jgi:hypothetical protein
MIINLLLLLIIFIFINRTSCKDLNKTSTLHLLKPFLDHPVAIFCRQHATFSTYEHSTFCLRYHLPPVSSLQARLICIWKTERFLLFLSKFNLTFERVSSDPAKTFGASPWSEVICEEMSVTAKRAQVCPAPISPVLRPRRHKEWWPRGPGFRWARWERKETGPTEGHAGALMCFSCFRRSVLVGGLVRTW